MATKKTTTNSKPSPEPEVKVYSLPEETVLELLNQYIWHTKRIMEQEELIKRLRDQING